MAALATRMDSGPQYFLWMENRRRNDFVTQQGQDREEEGEDVSRIPIVCEGSTSEIMQQHKKALHRFQLLKKKKECDRIIAELNLKKEKFKEKFEQLALRREELNQKDDNNRAHALEFEIYLKECEQKKQRAIAKYKEEQKIKSVKRQEIHALKQELKKLKIRQQALQKKMVKYKKIEDFLQKMADMLPSTEYAYLRNKEESIVRTLIKRHRTLMTENRNLLKHLSILQYALEETRHEFAVLQEEYNTQKYMLIAKASELHSKCSMLQDKNITFSQGFSSEKDQFTYQSKQLSSMVMAISNLAEQCYLRNYGPLEEMTLDSKLDMIQEYIVEKKEIKEEMMPLIGTAKSSIALFKEQVQRKKNILKQQTLYLEEKMP
ncbi:uncharacterized protein CCDC197 [Sceloporus undulatus]|uniref:uncharacterized protein CCDC197 n=1 Tax=Sceloporus undulatus TaxID=8520 RepID=UPI001C4C12B0|nr:uncharacterized protein CCDC197 [Sceloporus undulatus]